MFQSALLLSLALNTKAHARESIALLISDDIEEFNIAADAFIENATQNVEVFRIKGDRATAYRICDSLQTDSPPLVVAIGAKAAWTARQRLPTVPLVYAMVEHPERYGINGATVTGISLDAPPDLILSQFRLFSPETSSLAIFTSASINSPLIERARDTAEDLGYELSVFNVNNNKDLRKSLVYIHKNVDAIWLLPDDEVITPDNFYSIHTTAVRNHMPTLANSELLVKAGAFIGVTASYQSIGKQAAQVSERILGGDKSMYGSVLQPEEAQVVINIDTKKQIGIEVDPIVLSFANKQITNQ